MRGGVEVTVLTHGNEERERERGEISNKETASRFPVFQDAMRMSRKSVMSAETNLLPYTQPRAGLDLRPVHALPLISVMKVASRVYNKYKINARLFPCYCKCKIGYLHDS